MQNTLFDNVQHHSLPGGGELHIHKQWLDTNEADTLLNKLCAQTEWEQPSLYIAGAYKQVPRLQAWFGELGTAFTYSGKLLMPRPFTPLLKSLIQRIAKDSGETFNSVLINLYRNECDSVSWHADDEPEFGVHPIISSLSLGETRRFQLKPKPHFYEEAHWRKGQRTLSYDLAHGDLLIMGKYIQANWLHSVPKDPHPCKQRINLTFRSVLTGSGQEQR